MEFEKKLAKTIDSVNNTKTNNWRELSIIAEISPKDLELVLKLLGEEDPQEAESIKKGLEEYKTEILNHLNTIISQGRNYINKDAQFDIYWKSNVLPKID
jgi:predicted transcriptional regulator